jgi:hypothetical protein
MCDLNIFITRNVNIIFMFISRYKIYTIYVQNGCLICINMYTREVGTCINNCNSLTVKYRTVLFP